MYIWFEGIAGTWVCRGVRGDDVWPCWCAACRDGVSGWSVTVEAVGTKGCDASRGDTEIEVMEAEGCALYVRSSWNDGMVRACCWALAALYSELEGL